MAKSKSPFTGSWHIVSMTACDDEYLNEEVQAFIEFDEEGVRIVQFGYVRGLMDHYRTKKRDGKRVAQSAGMEKTAQTVLRWKALGGQFSKAVS